MANNGILYNAIIQGLCGGASRCSLDVTGATYASINDVAVRVATLIDAEIPPIVDGASTSQADLMAEIVAGVYRNCWPTDDTVDFTEQVEAIVEQFTTQSALLEPIPGGGVPGPPGPPGEQGEQGIQGIKGDKGDKGDTGNQGIQGIQGIQGLKGDAGNQGIQGIQGVKGDKGDTGDQGIQGIQGIQGLKGDTGDQGIQGVQGLQGIQGLKGDKGDTGNQGIQGIQGIQGEQGIAGSAGSGVIEFDGWAVNSAALTALYDLEDYRAGAKTTQGATGFGLVGYTGLTQGTSKPKQVLRSGTITAGMISMARAVVAADLTLGANYTTFTAGSANVTGAGNNYLDLNRLNVGDNILYWAGTPARPKIVTVAAIPTATTITLTAPAPNSYSGLDCWAFGPTLYSRVGIFRVLPGSGGGSNQQDRQLLGIATFSLTPPASPFISSDVTNMCNLVNCNSSFETPFHSDFRAAARLQRGDTNDGIYASTALQPRSGVGTLGANVGIPVQAGWLIGASLLFPALSGANTRYAIVDPIYNGAIGGIENYDFAHRYRYAIGGYAGVKLSFSVT